MKLSDYRETFYEFSGKASDIARQLSFAGIGVIWIFRIGDDKPEFPAMLFPALALFVIALSFDLFQYVVASVIWRIFYRHHEKKLDDINDDPELSAPWWINIPAYSFFIGKIALVFGGYTLLILYFF